jgi:hypothetical protein
LGDLPDRFAGSLLGTALPIGGGRWRAEASSIPMPNPSESSPIRTTPI